MEITLRVDIMPRHIRAAGVILAGVFVFVVCGSNSLPFRSQNALHIVGPFVAPLTELAQFIAIGPENSVPQRHRASGMAAYVAFFAVATTACSRYYAAPYVTAVLQGLHAALRGEAPSPDITQQLGAQQIEELICFLPTAFMAASLGVFTLALGLDLIGPWTALRTFHVVSGIVFLVSPAVKYPDVRTWAEATWQGENPSHIILGMSWVITAALLTTVRNRQRLAGRVIAHRQLAAQLEIDGPVGGRWGQNAADPADDEKAESPPFLSPRARHLLKSALAFSLTLALYGPVLKAFDLPTGSPVFALSSVI